MSYSSLESQINRLLKTDSFDNHRPNEQLYTTKDVISMLENSQNFSPSRRIQIISGNKTAPRKRCKSLFNPNEIKYHKFREFVNQKTTRKRTKSKRHSSSTPKQSKPIRKSTRPRRQTEFYGCGEDLNKSFKERKSLTYGRRTKCFLDSSKYDFLKISNFEPFSKTGGTGRAPTICPCIGKFRSNVTETVSILQFHHPELAATLTKLTELLKQL